MKVGELRTTLKNRKKDELEQLIVEMYKQFPKKMRETKEIDQLVQNPDWLKNKKKNANQSSKTLDITSVETEVRKFLKDAYAQNYIAPNRIIPKKERSNWRFTAKRLVKNVTELASYDDHKPACTSLLEELYKLFSYASGHYVFTSLEPFQTMKVPQEDFLKRVVLLKKEVEKPKKWIRESLMLVLENGIDRDILTSHLLETLVSALHNAPLKEEMVQTADCLLQKKEAIAKKVDVLQMSTKDFADKWYINNLVEMIFMTQSALGEYKEAIEYFYKHYREGVDREIRLYILLDMIMRYQRVEDWISEYETAVQKGVKPRDSLIEAYNNMKKTGEFPGFI